MVPQAAEEEDLREAVEAHLPAADEDRREEAEEARHHLEAGVHHPPEGEVRPYFLD